MNDMARIVRHGTRQTIELPEGFGFDGDEAHVRRDGGRIVLESAGEIDADTGLPMETLRARPAMRAISGYIADDSKQYADARFERVLAKVQLLADNPGIGPVQAGLTPELRSVELGHYRIYYRALADGVAVVRILHAARDLKRQTFD